MAKGVPIQGRNPSGNAQIANVTAEGDLKVQLSGSLIETDKLRNVPQAKTTIETVINAESVAAGGSKWASGVLGLGASQVWLLVNIDKQPWTLWIPPGPHYSSGSYASRAYPKRANVTTAYSDPSNPATSLVLPFDMGGYLDLAYPANWTEALLLAGPISDNTRFGVCNGSPETATVTVRVVRVWR